MLSQFSKPKQKRHRCRNPNKIDINTLTGEERVPVVNRRNGRKVSANDSLWLLSKRYPSFYPQEKLISSSCSLDGRGHGSTNEGASQMVIGEPRVFYRP